MSASTARRFSYAPEDPTLPKPWKGLVDGTTGYLYFWNTETNVTQYERPICKFDAGLPAEEPAAVSEEPLSTVDGGGEENTFPRNGAGGAEENSFPRNGDGDGVENSRPVAARGNPGSNCQVSRDMPSNMPAQSASLNAHSSNSEGSLSAESYRRKHEITVMGGDIPVPFMTFDVTGFPSLVLKQIHDAGFSAPTPIQAQSWPIALQGRDIVAVAKTGSGKTLGFLFPGFMHVGRLRNNRKLGPTMLILSPTRELATQIFDEAVKFGTSAIACTCLYGGASKGPQLRDIDRGVDVVVATPGRLNDILEMKRISLHQVSYLVLDEADRMLDMGFEPQIRKIVKEVTSRRQTLMFTATWPKVVRKIASDLLSNPVQVNIGNIDELVANKSITQYVEVMPSNQKRRRLEEILRSQEPGSKIIIFCSTKRMCDMLVQDLASKIGAAAIHGDKSQDERDRVLSQFRTGRSPVLVATDVAARGLDVKDIRVVINYDFPTGVEDYVHRIGRTGRGGATGISYTFFSDQDSKYAADLIKVLEGASQQVPSELHDMASRGSGGYGKFSRWGSGNDNTMRSYGDRSDSCQPSHGGYYSGGSRCQQGKPDSIDRRGYNSGPSTDATFSQDVPRSRSRSPPFRHADPTPAGGRWPSQHWDNC